MNRRDLIVGAAAAAGTVLLPRLARSVPLTRIDGRAFGTSWKVVVPAAVDAVRLAHRIDDLLHSLDAVLSPFRVDSELTRFNAAPIADPSIKLSPSLAKVMAEGLRVARLTGGAFDPTVGPMVARYGFGPIRGPAVPRAAAANFKELSLAGETIDLRRAGLTFDPCGIGKGYALDEIGRLISDAGMDDFFAEFGGEVLARGRHPSGRTWRSGIEDPAPCPLRTRHAVAMTGGALATSGDRVNSYVVGKRRYSHIIDPRTGAPVTNGIASVSVVAPTAMTADAMATALMVMGPEQGVPFATGEALPVLFVMRNGTGYRDVTNEAFRAYMVN